MMKKLIFIICFIILFPPLGLAAGPYYVKNGGSNGNTGLSDAQAWADLTNIDNASFDDGTDIYFKQGDTWTVTGAIDINHSGVDGNNRSIIGCYEADADFECSGAKPIIQNSTEGGFTFWFHDTAYLTFDQLDIRNSHASWEDTNGTGLYSGSDGTGGNHNNGYMHITDCDFSNFGHYAMHLAQMGSYNVITGNTFTNCGNAIYFVDESRTSTLSDYNYIANNTCTDLVGYTSGAIKIDGHCVGLQRNSYSIIEDNISTRSWNAVFVNWTGDVTTDVKSLIWRRNTSFDAHQGLILSGGNTTGDLYSMVYQNIMVNTGTGPVPYANRPVVFLDSMNQTRVFNNTFYDAQYASNGARGNLTTSDYTYWVNNIFVMDGDDDNGITDIFSLNEDTPTNVTWDYNLYWSLEGDPTAESRWTNETSATHTWAQWIDAGNENNDTNSPSPADPLFAVPGSDDFTLLAGSPAIDTGGYLTYVTACSGTTITVADNRWFHGDFGLADADGVAITGMEITFYDTTNDLQNRTITTDEITYAAPGGFTINTELAGCLTGGNADTPSDTTQIALRFIGTAPDIGANEYAGAPPAATAPFSGVSCQGCIFN